MGNDVILPILEVRFRGEVSIYSAKTTTILVLSLLIKISPLSSASSNIP